MVAWVPVACQAGECFGFTAAYKSVNQHCPSPSSLLAPKHPILPFQKPHDHAHESILQFVKSQLRPSARDHLADCDDSEASASDGTPVRVNHLQVKAYINSDPKQQAIFKSLAQKDLFAKHILAHHKEHLNKCLVQEQLLFRQHGSVHPNHCEINKVIECTRECISISEARLKEINGLWNKAGEQAAAVLHEFHKDNKEAGVKTEDPADIVVPERYFHPQLTLNELAYSQYEYFEKVYAQMEKVNERKARNWKEMFLLLYPFGQGVRGPMHGIEPGAGAGPAH